LELQEVFKYLFQMIVVFFGAYFGSQIALNKFKKEKLWEQKRAIYKEIIEAFEELGFWSQYIKASHYFEPTIEVNIQFDHSLRIISKHTATGALFLSDDFQIILKDANVRLNQVLFEVNEERRFDNGSEQSRAEWLLIMSKEIRVVIDSFLPKLISIAKKEIPK